MLELDIWQLIHAPLSWSPEQLNYVKQYFQHQRPSGSAAVVSALWLYWRQICPDRLLFEQDEDNVALLLHARGFGETIPALDARNIFGQLLERHRHLFEAPLISRLVWGARSVLSSEVLVGLQSPIMHAWVFLEDRAPQQILIVGEGVPEIREQIVPMVFMTSLRIHGSANDMVNVGMLRVELPSSSVPPLSLPFNIIGNRRGSLPKETLDSAAEALRELHGVLKKLEQDSGLVQVHELDIEKQTAIHDSLKRSMAVAVKDEAVLWAPGANANADRNAHSASDAVTVTPYWYTSREEDVLHLALSSDLLKTDMYEQLLNAYQYATIDRVLMDVYARRELYERSRKSLEAEKRHYDSCTQPQRFAIWGPAMTLEIRFEKTIGVEIRLAEPIERATDQYFNETVPQLIEDYRQWQHRMEDIEISLRTAVRTADAPVRRLAAARFFDAALRDCIPEDSPSVRGAYEVWSKQVQPLLRFEWRCLLKRLGIKERYICTPHTFFHTWFTPTEDRKDIETLIMAPFTLIDQQRSAVLFDADHHVMVVYDATDFVTPSSKGLETAEQLLEQLIIEQSNENEQRQWDHLLQVAEQPNITAEEFGIHLHAAIREDPANILRRILTSLLQDRAISVDSMEQDSEQMMLEQNLQAAMRATSLSRGMSYSLRARSANAVHTARNCLSQLVEDITDREKPWLVRVHLLRTVIEIEATGQDFVKTLPNYLPDRLAVAPPDVQRSLQQALDADKNYVLTWVQNLSKMKPGIALSVLVQGLPQTSTQCTADQYATLLARGAVELARLAREIDQAVDLLAEERETIDVAYAKLGFQLEQAVLAQYSDVVPNELFNLIELLTGRELPKLRRSRI